jgi:drug/metabolite transporter (DMT)-like permease
MKLTKINHMIKIYLFLTLCVLFWSGNIVMGKYFAADIDPLQLSFFRWLFVAILLAPFLIKDFKNIVNTTIQNFLILNILAILSVVGFNTLMYFALQTTLATNALLINSIVPVEILILSFFILKIKIVLKQFIGICLSMVGVVFLIIKGDISVLKALAFDSGDLLVLLAGIIWALYSVLIKFKPQELKAISFLVVITYIGLFWLNLIYLFNGYSLATDIVLIEKYYLVILYVSIFASILSFIFWNSGVETIGANKTGQFTHLMPLFGSILAYIFLGELLHFYHIIGAVIIMIGIYLSLFSQAK